MSARSRPINAAQRRLRPLRDLRSSSVAGGFAVHREWRIPLSEEVPDGTGVICGLWLSNPQRPGADQPVELRAVQIEFGGPDEVDRDLDLDAGATSVRFLGYLRLVRVGGRLQLPGPEPAVCPTLFEQESVTARLSDEFDRFVAKHLRRQRLRDRRQCKRRTAPPDPVAGGSPMNLFDPEQHGILGDTGTLAGDPMVVRSSPNSTCPVVVVRNAVRRENLGSPRSSCAGPAVSGADSDLSTRVCPEPVGASGPEDHFSVGEPPIPPPRRELIEVYRDRPIPPSLQKYSRHIGRLQRSQDADMLPSWHDVTSLSRLASTPSEDHGFNRLIIAVPSCLLDDRPSHGIWVGGLIQSSAYNPAPSPRERPPLDPATVSLIAALRDSVTFSVRFLDQGSDPSTTDSVNVAAVVEALQGAHRAACWIYTSCLEGETLVWDWASVAQDLDWAATAVAGGALEPAGKVLRPLLQRLPSA
jgi:hypothetical protein